MLAAAAPMRRVIALTALFFAGLALGIYQPVEGKPKRRRASSTESCRVDSDCALVTDGCCNCNEGGKQRAILSRGRKAYEKRRKSICQQIMCPALMSEDASCVAGHAICKDGGCDMGL
jgi:hypothetical protein